MPRSPTIHLTGIRAVARYRMPDGREVNVKKGCKVGRNCDIYFYLNRGARIYVSAADLFSWERLGDVPVQKTGKQLTVYGGRQFVGSKQCRMIVATYTKKRAMELLGVSASEFNGYWIATKNVKELEVAMAAPEEVFFCENQYRKDEVYKKLEEGDRE